jgi:probable rRNA maturation factor
LAEASGFAIRTSFVILVSSFVIVEPAVISIAIADQQTALPVDRRLLRRAVRMLLADHGVGQAEISLAVVDDAAIRRVNRQYLGHDRATDVISFLLERGADALVGEVIASAETAHRVAPRYGWPAREELLLYVVHGTLHLVGHDDRTAAQRAAMRARESDCLARLGVRRDEG